MKWLLGSNYWLFWYVVLFTTLYKPVGYHVACSSTPGRMRTHSITHSFSFISIMIFWKLQDDFIHHTLDTAHCKMEVAKSPQERLKWSIKSLIVMMAIIIAYSEEGITAKRESQRRGNHSPWGYLRYFLLGVCAAGFSEPLPQYSIFCGQI